MRFTFILEIDSKYDVGAVIYQETAPDLANAIVKWAKNLPKRKMPRIGSKTMSEILESAHSRTYDVLPLPFLPKAWTILFFAKRYFDLTVTA